MIFDNQKENRVCEECGRQIKINEKVILKDHCFVCIKCAKKTNKKGHNKRLDKDFI